jgi:lipoate-protein ligase B
MQTFTTRRHAGQTSELWLVEHPPVFTQGQAGKAEHVLDAGTMLKTRLQALIYRTGRFIRSQEQRRYHYI